MVIEAELKFDNKLPIYQYYDVGFFGSALVSTYSFKLSKLTAEDEVIIMPANKNIALFLGYFATRIDDNIINITIDEKDKNEKFVLFIIKNKEG